MKKQRVLLNKALVIGIIILFIGMSITPSIAVETVQEPTIPTSNGKTLYVGGTGEGNYTKIQDAIDNASSGDTVFVYDDSSPYYEHIIVHKIINLVGENRDTTIIDGGGSGIGVYIPKDWSNISGFTIQNSGLESHHAGIRLNSNYNTVTGNIISNNGNGIKLQGSHNAITGNTISNNEDGINLQGSHNNINGNIISNNKVGIFLQDAKNDTVMGNNISKNNKGIAMKKSNSDHTIIKNNFFLNIKHVFFRCTADLSKSNFPPSIKWSQNYWSRPRILPKLLSGRITIIMFFVGDVPTVFILPLPWINIDWLPAKEPYEI